MDSYWKAIFDNNNDLEYLLKNIIELSKIYIYIIICIIKIYNYKNIIIMLLLDILY